jgi:hypothetical protein
MKLVFENIQCLPLFSGSRAHYWALAYFQFLNPTHVGRPPLDGGPARRKVATYTRHNTNLERGTIQASNGIRTQISVTDLALD